MKILYLLVVLAFSLLSACGGSGGGKSDTTPPVITLMGDNPMTIEAGSTFTDPGSSVSDDVDSGLTTIVTGAVDTATTDTYTLRYNVSDAAGNAATTVTRTVNVVLQEAFLGATLECPWDESDPTMHVFLAAGQSNMVSAYGRPGTLPTAYETGTDMLQMWDEGSWKRLGLSTENADHGPRYGPELAFAWTLHAACPDSTIGIVKYAVGGSLISTWIPGGENAAVLVSNITAAIQAHPDITFEGFLYKQGAADGRLRVTGEVWGENFLSIVDAFRNNGITPNTLPFLVGTTRGTADIDAFPDDITDLDPDSVSPPDPSRPFLLHVIHQQWMVQFERPFIYPVIDRDIPKGADETHHTPEGIRMVGRKFAEVYLTQAMGSAIADILTTETIGGVEVEIRRGGNGVYPLVVFSHGMGACPESTAGLQSRLANRGYIVVAPKHQDCHTGSTTPDVAWNEPENWTDQTNRDRRDDFHAVLDALPYSSYAQYVEDFANIGCMGHSMGGYTCMGLAGAWGDWTRSEIRTVAAMSPWHKPLTVQNRVADMSNDQTLYQGGTSDGAITPPMIETGGTFDQTSPAKYLQVFDRAGHFAWTDGVFSEQFHDEMSYYLTSFFDAFLKDGNKEKLTQRKSRVSTLDYDHE